MSPVDVLKAAADRGLTLRINGEKLRVLPAEHLSLDFANTLRSYKPRLLSLLRLPFVMVESQILEETIFFCQDEDTKAALIEAGADEWSIYTKDELRVLVAQNRIAPLSADELCKLHEIKKTFDGKVTSQAAQKKANPPWTA